MLDVTEIWGGSVDFTFRVNSEVSNPVVLVEYTDPSGQVCGDVVEKTCTLCDSAAVIGYTTLGMQVDEVQTLEAQVDGSLDDDTDYTWAIASGGGSLSSGEGNSVDYTAPATNAECTDNPIIQLSCNGVVIDSISMAVNAVPDAGAVFENYTECYDWGGGWDFDTWGRNCQGNTEFFAAADGPNSEAFCRDHYPTDSPGCNGPTGGTGDSYTGGTCDYRSEAEVTAGCCPEKLI